MAFTINGIHLDDGTVLDEGVGLGVLNHYSRDGRRYTVVTGLRPRTDACGAGTHNRQHSEWVIRDDGKVYDATLTACFGTLASLDQARALQNAPTLA
jgi:hypothetical protein